jgi:ribosomal protein S18 acetylase RimI-like enzyme
MEKQQNDVEVKVDIKRVGIADTDNIAPLIAKFRVELLAYKNSKVEENLDDAKEEFESYIKVGYPVYVCEEGDKWLGYLVCRIDTEVVWVESLFVLSEHRRRGIASALFNAAEDLAVSYGNDTLYNYVHPNNDDMIAFLNKRGYNVLNLIEIRKKYKGEKINEQIQIRNNFFDY